MAGLWDRIRAFFRSGRGADADAQIEQAVRVALVRRVSGRSVFTPLELGYDIVPREDRTDEVMEAIADALDRLYVRGYFGPFNYARSIDPKSVYRFVYHPAGTRVAGTTPDTIKPRVEADSEPPPPPAPTARRATPAPTPARTPRSTTPTAPSRGASSSTTTPYRSPGASAPYRAPADPFARPDILSLSASELRAKALKIDPYKTAWIGRVDTIPPQSDERTAIIDRGLILRGLLTEAQITEIHRVGDLWLRHSEATRMAATVAAKNAEEALRQLREEKARKKAEKIRESAERKRKHAEGVARRKATDIIFLGRGVSSRLGDRRSDIEKLTAQGLPLLSTPKDIADAMRVTITDLRWLAFHSEAAEKTHYVSFTVPKRSGGVRRLSAPHEKLARAQQWILREVLEKLPTEAAAHGFITGHSTVTNALPHVKRDVVVNLDLKDFFPTISFARVRGVLEKIGYSPAVATVLALLCTESPRHVIEYDKKPYHVAVGPRVLPQGACTSPALSNQVARKLDRRLSGLCAKMGWTYTRYADDLTMSADEGHRGELPVLIAKVREIVEDEGFAINPKKGRVQRKSARQTVTGVVVNDHPTVPRDEYKQLRAILHQAKFTGLAAQNREGREHFEDWVEGKIAYIAMVDATKGARLKSALAAIAKR
ncbi:MAG: reverse transcriptase family protein [Polyangiales bacterium]